MRGLACHRIARALATVGDGGDKKKGLDRGGMPVRDPIQGLDYVGRVRVQDASAESPASLLRLSAAARIGNTESNPFNPPSV